MVGRGDAMEIMINNSKMCEQACRDENIQSFFRGFELPFRLSVASSPYLTEQQKQQLDFEIHSRMSVIECIVRAINALV